MLRDSRAGSRVSFRSRESARYTRPGHEKCVSRTSDPGFNPSERRSGTQTLALDSRLRGNERSLLFTPFVPAKAGTQGHAVSQQVADSSDRHVR